MVNVRPHSLPVKVLNLIDQGLGSNAVGSKGSLHIQSILTTANPQLSSHILSSLLHVLLAPSP